MQQGRSQEERKSKEQERRIGLRFLAAALGLDSIRILI
jgi:hypothetical protein